MKLKTQENIKKIEFFTYIAALVASKTILNNDIPAYVPHTLLNIYLMDYILTSYTEKYTCEYKEMRALYDEIIKNTATFYKDIDLKNPIGIFATYIYMYRSGLFSYNQDFKYSDDMKDFAKLSGMDVVRGSGVCRSIASMLSDIYNEIGINSRNLAVNVNPDTMHDIPKLNPIQLKHDVIDKHNITFNIARNTKKMPNHQINMVEKNGLVYILDPTNDLFLINNSHKLIFGDDDNSYMKISYFISIADCLLGQIANGYNFITDSNMLLLDTISQREYEINYLETIKFCLNNQQLFQEFYQNNNNIINDIYKISKEQDDYIRRRLVFLPKKLTK